MICISVGTQIKNSVPIYLLWKKWNKHVHDLYAESYKMLIFYANERNQSWPKNLETYHVHGLEESPY